MTAVRGACFASSSSVRCCSALQIVYILDQVRALEKEILKRFEDQGVEVEVQILVVTRLIPEAQVPLTSILCWISG